MNKLSILLFAILFIALISNVKLISAKPNFLVTNDKTNIQWPSKEIPGEIQLTNINTDLQDVSNALFFLLKELKEIKSLDKVYKQFASKSFKDAKDFAAGVHFFVEGNFLLAFSTKPIVQECRLKILSQPKKKYKLEYKVCQDKETSRSFSKSLVKSLPKKVDMKNSKEVIKALQVLPDLSAENVAIGAIYKQFLNGIKYTFTGTFQNKNKKQQPCIVEVLISEPWQQEDKKSKLVKNTCSNEFPYIDQSIVKLNKNDKKVMRAMSGLSQVKVVDLSAAFRQITGIKNAANSENFLYMVRGKFLFKGSNKPEECFIGVLKNKKNYELVEKNCV